jgi:hypothetical protein
MLAALAHCIWVRGDSVQPELFGTDKSLDRQSRFLCAGKSCTQYRGEADVRPDLATTLVKKAKVGGEKKELDHQFLHFTLTALTDIKDKRRRLLAIEKGRRSCGQRKDFG